MRNPKKQVSRGDSMKKIKEQVGRRENLIILISLILISVMLVLNLSYKPETRILTEQEKCLQQSGYLTCEAIRFCGGMDKVAEVTSGGFFGINQGFKCK